MQIISLPHAPGYWGFRRQHPHVSCQRSVGHATSTSFWLSNMPGSHILDGPGLQSYFIGDCRKKLLVARAPLLVAPGITTSNKKLLVTSSPSGRRRVASSMMRQRLAKGMATAVKMPLISRTNLGGVAGFKNFFGYLCGHVITNNLQQLLSVHLEWESFCVQHLCLEASTTCSSIHSTRCKAHSGMCTSCIARNLQV